MFIKRKNFITASTFHPQIIFKPKTILYKSTIINENAEKKAKSKMMLYEISGRCCGKGVSTNLA